MDVVCLNRYYGWYNLSGDLDAACRAWREELDFWAQQGKPVMLTEYGADTVEGLHDTRAGMFSEEFQAEYYERIDAVCDEYPFFVGEILWNFADFATIQGPCGWAATARAFSPGTAAPSWPRTCCAAAGTASPISVTRSEQDGTEYP